MCRTGGRRCEISEGKREHINKKRRVEYWKNKTDKKFEEIKAEWAGETPIDLSSPTVKHAYKLAVIAHSGVRRKTGDTYINHPLRVAKFLQEKGFEEKVVAAAVLHDAVEDSDLTLEELNNRHGFSPEILSGVDSVTKREGEDYTSAMKRAAGDPIGRLVKLSDNLDNSSRKQLMFLSAQKRLKAEIKYSEGRRYLWKSLYQNSEDTSQRDSYSGKFSLYERAFSQ